MTKKENPIVNILGTKVSVNYLKRHAIPVLALTLLTYLVFQKRLEKYMGWSNTTVVEQVKITTPMGDDAKEIEKKLNNKVDKSQYNEDKNRILNQRFVDKIEIQDQMSTFFQNHEAHMRDYIPTLIKTTIKTELLKYNITAYEKN